MSLAAADWTFFYIGQLIGNFSSKLIDLSSSLHEPVSIDAKNVEPVEAVIDAHQVDSVCEGLGLKLGLIHAEWLEADGTTPTERIVVLAEAVAQILVHQVEEAVDSLSILVAMSLQALNYVAFEHVDLVIVKTLDSCKFEPRWLLGELDKSESVSQSKNQTY